MLLLSAFAMLDGLDCTAMKPTTNVPPSNVLEPTLFVLMELADALMDTYLLHVLPQLPLLTGILLTVFLLRHQYALTLLALETSNVLKRKENQFAFAHTTNTEDLIVTNQDVLMILTAKEFCKIPIV
jgi:hypothetical protein